MSSPFGPSFDSAFSPVARRLAFVAPMAVLAASLAGCNVLGAAWVLIAPERPVQAQYKIPEKHVVAVIVDDYRQASTSPNLSGGIASAATFHLGNDGKIQVVSDARVQEAIAKLGDRWTGKHGEKPVSAASLGAALHADTVIYANVESAQIQLADSVYQPQVVLSVKAYETATGKCVFPLSPDGDNLRQTGFVIQTDISPKDVSADGRSAASNAETKLAAQAGLDLAQLFYKHGNKRPGDNLGKP